MNHPDYANLIEQLTGTSLHEQLAAKMILLAMQEDAIDPLADLLYAGVNDASGRAIIDVVATIGGYEALLLLKQIFDFNQNTVFVLAAARGLIHNVDQLSREEREAVSHYLLKND